MILISILLSQLVMAQDTKVDAKKEAERLARKKASTSIGDYKKYLNEALAECEKLPDKNLYEDYGINAATVFPDNIAYPIKDFSDTVTNASQINLTDLPSSFQQFIKSFNEKSISRSNNGDGIDPTKPFIILSGASAVNPTFKVPQGTNYNLDHVAISFGIQSQFSKVIPKYSKTMSAEDRKKRDLAMEEIAKSIFIPENKDKLNAALAKRRGEFSKLALGKYLLGYSNQDFVQMRGGKEVWENYCDINTEKFVKVLVAQTKYTSSIGCGNLAQNSGFVGNRQGKFYNLTTKSVFDKKTRSAPGAFLVDPGNRGYSLQVDMGTTNLGGKTFAFNYNAFFVPDRFILEYMGEVLHDTGFVGSGFQNTQKNSKEVRDICQKKNKDGLCSPYADDVTDNEKTRDYYVDLNSGRNYSIALAVGNNTDVPEGLNIPFIQGNPNQNLQIRVPNNLNGEKFVRIHTYGPFGTTIWNARVGCPQ